MTLATGVWYAAVVAGSAAVVWKGSGLLDRASERLAGHYGLPPIVRGAIVAAVGSSMPELSSTVLATLLHGQFDLGVGAIVGSAVFNILVIPAASALSRGRELEASRTLVYKEAQFYMLAVSVLLLTFAFAVIYDPAGNGRLVGTMTRPLAFVPVALYGLYVFIQYQDLSEYDGEPVESVAVGRRWLELCVGLVLIVVAVEGLVRAAIGLGDLLDTPSFVWGLVVVAAGTSLPDLFVSLRAASEGPDGGVTSLANVLGSNTFDLLVAVPAGVLIVGTTTVDFAAAVPMMACLTVATLVLFTLLRTDLSLTDREAYVLLAAYVAFVGWVALETVGAVGLLPVR
ncbi:sodium:calcium antiporter [Haloplanus rubicundus]|uniref:Sodium:calcium antiporter n=1 Tax=Haloplanus rubicundus TaxID=1547898 RepID=A0A345E4S5_9EURY|nr:sodium:calcium antiporter [Haloplanus rubicundus]AXG07197.1 sodium:calcium antiporter [Haloplanus rubicundus]